jgi:RNA polymerase sigma-70 factor (ECF subfamily)
MDNPTDSATSPTLLGRLRLDPNNQTAWNTFVQRYGPRIYGWCRGWNLQDADAQDVTQNVLLKLAAKLCTFQYDPAGSFRGWLKTLTHHAWHDFQEGRRRAGLGSGDSQVAQLLDSVEARDDLARRLEEEFDQELLEQAMARVRLRVQARTWEAFRLTALEGLSGAEAAARLDMKVAHVFVAKSEVREKVQEELRKLEGAPT